MVAAVLAAAITVSAYPPDSGAKPRAAVRSALRQDLARRTMTATKIVCGPVDARTARCRFRARRDTPNGTVNSCKGNARVHSVRRHWNVRARARCKVARLGPAPALGFEDIGSEDRLVAVTAAAGATTDRLGVDWGEVEPLPNVYNWDRFDHLYKRFVTAGIRPVLVLEGAPLWAALPAVDCGFAFCISPPASAHDGDWRRFVAEAARRYPLAMGFEIWNEPNYDVFWSSGPDPARYTALLKSAYSSVKSVNPAMPVILGGLYPSPIPGVAYSDPAVFLAEVYRHGGGSSFDAVGAHPYPSGPPWVRSIMAMLSPLRQVMTANGDAMVPFWLTEVGVSTRGRASEADQATALTDLLDTARSSGEIGVVMIHELRDQKGPWPEWTWGLGVLRADGTPKPAFCALAARVGHSCNVPG